MLINEGVFSVSASIITLIVAHLSTAASFWTAEEVDLSKDLADWDGLKVC